MIARQLILLFTLLLSLNACAMGGKPIRPHKLPERKLQDKLWRPCQDFETPKPVGKFCNRVCKKRSSRKCKEWKTNIRDFNNPEHFKFFRAGTFILIDEDQVL